jgi:hypothetical protein
MSKKRKKRELIKPFLPPVSFVCVQCHYVPCIVHELFCFSLDSQQSFVKRVSMEINLIGFLPRRTTLNEQRKKSANHDASKKAESFESMLQSQLRFVC